MNRRFLSLFLGFVATGLLASGEPRAVVLAGSSTVTRVLMPLKTGVDAAYQVEIRLVPNGSGHGLAEMIAGRADAAMLSGPIDFLWAQIEARHPTGLTADCLEKLKLADNPKAELVAVLHPGNSLRQLTTLQLRAVLSGSIVNWRELGGGDQPIHLVLPDELDGVRASVAAGLMDGTNFAASARVVARTPEVVAVVAALPGAIGLVPRSALAADAVYAELKPRFAVSLYIVALKARLEADPKLEMVLNSLQSRAR